MIDPNHRKISVSRQCRLLDFNRSRIYYKPRRERKEDLQEKIQLKELFLQYPFYGYRKMSLELSSQAVRTSEKRVRRLMRELGLKALAPKKMTSSSNRENPVYPYLLKGKNIRYPNQVWAADITYLRMEKGFAYLAAIMDIYSRKVLSWRISQTLDADFCIEALKEAFKRYGSPAIFNTDQGCQFTSYRFIRELKESNVRISMDGQGRWRDNIYVERFWKSLKYEDIYLRSYENLKELKKGLSRYFRFYNGKRFHQSLTYRTPDEMYESFQIKKDINAA